MRFEWDREKASANRKKHRVSFDEAATVFYDLLAATFNDADHSTRESRFLTIGCSSRDRLLVVSHTERGNTLRIISARLASAKSANAMKAKPSTSEMRSEYDFDYSKAVRGKYYKRLLKEGSNVVVLEPDIAKAFPDSAAVNDALRVVLKAGQSARRPTGRSSRTRTKAARAG
jgi:hypothetical protein